MAFIAHLCSPNVSLLRLSVLYLFSLPCATDYVDK